MAPFDSFSPEALRYLADLKAINTRDWFTANKGTYETQLKNPSTRFADAMALALRDFTAMTMAARSSASIAMPVSQRTRRPKTRTCIWP